MLDQTAHNPVPTVYAAIELSKKSWVVAIMQPAKDQPSVLDPASLQVNRRARRVKTDRIDVLMLLRALIAVDRGDRHVCSIVRVPTIEEEDVRRSHRERQRLIRERTAHINRIKRLLFGQGIRDVEPRAHRRGIAASSSAARRTRALSIPVEDMLAGAKWRTVSWRNGTKAG